MAPWSEGAKKGESGLVDRAWYHVNKSRFGFPFPDNTETCALMLDCERTDSDGSKQDDRVWIPVGQFEPGDPDGTFAIHESQEPDRHFANFFAMGKFLRSAKEVGLMEVLEQRQAPDRAQYEEKDALIWEGLDLDIEYVEETFTYKKGPKAGQQGSSRNPVIRGFKADGAESSAPAAAASAPASSSNGTLSEDEAKEIAKGAGSWIKTLEILTEKHGLDPSHEYAQKQWYEQVVGS